MLPECTKMRIFRCNFAKFSRGHVPRPPRMVVPSALPLKLICDVTQLWRNLPPSEVFCVRRCFQERLEIYWSKKKNSLRTVHLRRPVIHSCAGHVGQHSTLCNSPKSPASNQPSDHWRKLSLSRIAEKLDKGKYCWKAWLAHRHDGQQQQVHRIFTTRTGERDSWTTQKSRISWKTI